VAYDALIFDLGGVIVPHDNAVLRDRLASRCSAPHAADWLIDAEGDERIGTGELTIPELHRRLVEEIGYGGDWATFANDWCSHLKLDHAMLDLVERLAAANRVMLFSNTNQAHWDSQVAASDGRLARLEAYLSHEIGAVKPHVAAFELVARLAAVEPGRCLFIDDRLDNVEAAREAGFHAELFVGQAALEARLRAAAVEWPQPIPMESA